MKAAADTLHLCIGMPYGDEEGIQRFVDDVSDPKSPNYRRFITPTEVGRRFGIASANVQKVSDYLVSQGIKIRLVAKNRLSILADATVAQAEKAFHTTIAQYQVTNPSHPDDTLRFSFTNPPSVPTEIRAFVNVVSGLENFVRPKFHSTLNPDQLRVLYGAAPAYNSGFQGLGRTVAISNWDGFRLNNIPLEYSHFNLPKPAGGYGSNVSVVAVDGATGNTDKYQGEGDIDIQCVLAIAPLCNLIIYDNSGIFDYLGVLTQEADDNLADILTESYGWPSSPADTYVPMHNIHLSMSAQGMTYMSASGDTGTSGVQQYPYPDEDPECLSVGGTTAVVDGLGNRASESAWNNTGYAGGGGWTPNADPFNKLPAYQKGNGVPTNIPYRLAPDISLDGDPNTGYQIFVGGLLQLGWGGTSCASPTAAGALANIEQQLIAAGALKKDGAGKQRFGRIQDLLYSFNGDPHVFFDVTDGDNGGLPDGSLSAAKVGWDMASGWGAPNFNGIVNKILGNPTLIGFTLSESEVLGGTSLTGTVTIDAPAPAKGAIVTFSADLAVAIPPISITIPAGATTATFPVNTGGAAQAETATIAATEAGTTLYASLIVTPSALASMSIAPASVVGGDSALGKLVLNGAAPIGGYDVTMTSSDPAVTVPQHVEVAEGATSDLFAINTSNVTTTKTVTITASYGGFSVTANLTVTPGSLTGLAISPTSVSGGLSATGTMTLNGPAPIGGTTVALSSDTTAVTVPDTVVVPAGASKATFTLSTHSVASTTVANITASQGFNGATAELTVTGSTLSAISLSPNTVIGGSSSTGTVTLGGPAGGSGVTVSLSSDNANATVPATVTIPAGASSATFTTATSPVTNTVTATITATAGGLTQTATLTIQTPLLQSVSVAPSSVIAGTSATGTITLSRAAPNGGVIVSLSSSSSSASVPGSVSIAAGASTGTFSVTSFGVASATTVTFTATFSGTSKTASLTVQPAGLSSLSIAPTTVGGGSSATGTVKLNGVAPSAGLAVSLTSNSGSAVVPATALVPAGATSATFTVSTKAVSSATTATISASAGSGSVSAVLGVLPASLLSVSLSAGSIVGGSTASLSGVVRLTGMTTGSGASVSLKSSDPKALTVPSTIKVSAGGSSATFAVTHKKVVSAESVTVTATLGGVSQSASITLNPFQVISVALSPTTVTGGTSSSGVVTLNATPSSSAGSILVKLSSNSSAASVPATCSVPPSSVSAKFKVTTKAVAANTTATITAALGATSAQANLSIQASSLIGLTLAPQSVKGSSTTVVTGTVTMSGPAPAGGVSVGLASSNSGAASAPGAVLIPAGRTSATFKVSHKSVSQSQTVTFTATLGGVSKAANLSVTK